MSKRVLFVNNTVSYASNSQLLRDEGYSVDVVDNVGTGLNQPDVQAYDIAILQESPQANSHQLCERIRQLRHTPLIVISTNASADTCVKAIDAGADYFMRKPFGPLEFLARVQSLLQRTSVKQSTPLGV